MKNVICIIIQLALATLAFADTPPPGTVKAKMYSGDGVNAVAVSGGGAMSVAGTFWQATQPVSGTLTCNAGSGTLAVSGPLTDAQLRATAVPVSGTITATNSANGATGSAVPAQATQIGGSDGTSLRAVKVSSAGVVSVDGSATTQPISAASLPLPAGASTSVLQSSIITALGSPFQAGGSIGNSSFGISGTLPAYAATPTFNLGTLNGAATAANQSTEITSLSTIATNTGSIVPSGSASCTLTNSGDNGCTLTTNGASSITVENSGSIGGLVGIQCAPSTFFELIPVFDYGTRTAQLFISTNDNASANIGGCKQIRLHAYSALGAAIAFVVNTNAGVSVTNVTSSGPSQFYATANMRDGSSNALTSTGAALDVNLKTSSITLPVSVASVPLPTGAATSALQTSGNSSLTTIATNIPAQGQALAGASMPVVLTAAQVTTLTPPTSVTVTQGTAANLNATVTGTVTANAGTGTFAVSAASLPLPSGAATAAKQPALGTAGSASADVLSVQGVASMTALKVDGSGVTQPVSAASLPLPTGAATSALQSTGNTSVASIDTKTPALGQALAAASVPVVLTAAQVTTLTPPASVTVTQGTAANLNATVTGTVALSAGSAVIGHVINDASSAVIGHVIVDTTPSTAVTNAGTFAVQSTPVVPTALTVHQAAVTIGTSAVRLTYNGSAAAATRVLLVAQLISTSTANCYFGSSGVTTTSTTRGVQMFAGQAFSFNNDAGDYYAICDAATQTFFITEQE